MEKHVISMRVGMSRATNATTRKLLEPFGFGIVIRISDNTRTIKVF